MPNLSRILKHRLYDETTTRRAFDESAIERLTQRVMTSERRHSGEIRVCVEASLPLSYLWQDLTARDRAVTMFGKLRVWDTAANNGVLIYLLLAERAIEIVADRGVSRHVADAEWKHILQGMRDDFHEGRHEDGLMRAIDAVDDLLVRHFALSEATPNPNELADRPYMR
jgi:uncharacterized membrane protein YgcG